MAFTTKQRRSLVAKLKYRHVKTRSSQGSTLSYLEGWHVIAEANRIFGYDCWDRKTLSPRCVWSERQAGQVAAFYTTKVRITVRAGGEIIMRDGIGTGFGRAAFADAAHEIGLESGRDRRDEARSLPPSAIPSGWRFTTKSTRASPGHRRPRRHSSCLHPKARRLPSPRKATLPTRRSPRSAMWPVTTSCTHSGKETERPCFSSKARGRVAAGECLPMPSSPRSKPSPSPSADSRQA